MQHVSSHFRPCLFLLNLFGLLLMIGALKAEPHSQTETGDLLRVPAPGKAGTNRVKALPYPLAAIESANATAATSQLAVFYGRVGTTSRELNQHQLAFRRCQQLIRKQSERNTDLTWTDNDDQIIRFLLPLNRPGQELASHQQTFYQYQSKNTSEAATILSAPGRVHLALKEYPAGVRYLLTALLKINKKGYCWAHYFQIDISHQIAKLPMVSGRYQKFYDYLLWVIALNGQHILPQKTGLNLQALRIGSLQRNFFSAKGHCQQCTAPENSLLNEWKTNVLIANQIKYTTEIKHPDLKLMEHHIDLPAQKSNVRQDRGGQGQMERNTLIGGACLLLLVLGLGYNRYRLKQRSNKQLQAQQQKLQAQHQALQAQQEVLQAQQHEINQKNRDLSQLLSEKDSLLVQKDILIREKEGLLGEKDSLLSRQMRLLEEKERLLKEIHHRVKNNLQVVMSLLNSQADSLQEKAALSAIRESQHRVQAMALIHQKLYHAEGVTRIPMQDYIEEVVAYLHESYCLDHLVRFCLEVEPIELDVTQAVPLGLIISEAITNAFKYAFSDGRSGTVCLSLYRLAETTYQLTIADDGIGLPTHYNPSRCRSLGMTLLHGFSGQLGGELTLISPPGLTINLVFEEEQLSPG
jgi:two-component sensor histidine kinase